MTYIYMKTSVKTPSQIKRLNVLAIMVTTPPVDTKMPKYPIQGVPAAG